MPKKLSKEGVLDQAAALLREHFGHAVIVIADGDDAESIHFTKFTGNASCCRGLLSDAWNEEFNPPLTIEIDDDAEDGTETE